MVKKNQDHQKGETSVEVTPAPPAPPLGLRRSRRLQNLPPPSPPAEGDSTTPAAGGEGHALVGDGDADVNVGGALATGGGSSSSSHDMGTVESPASAPAVEEIEAHPCLLNEDILDMVFKHVVNQPGPSNHVLADIQNFRLVSQPWRNSMTRVYRQARPALWIVRLKESPWVNCLWKPRSLTNFVDTMRASDMIPVQKYILDRNVFDENLSTKVVGDFFRICGPGVVSLDMTIKASDAGRIMDALQTALPPDWDMMKMKTLVFHIGEGPVEGTIGQERGTADMLGLFLDAGKTLREFQLSYCDYSADPLITLEEHLGQLIATRIPRTVKQFILDMEFTITGSIFHNLAESGLTLESFEFLVPSLLENGSLYKFLESQAATLKSFRIWCEEGIPMRFPCLGELLLLELSEVIVTETDFAKSFPKLHCLELERIEDNDAIVSLLSSVKTTAPSVKVLSLPRNYNKPLPRNYNEPFSGHLNKFGQCFPFLAELHIRLRTEVEEALEEVFKYFDNLECLDICFADTIDYYHLDSIFSGISESDCDRIEQCPCSGFDDKDLEELERGRSSLLNLTKLKKLVVWKNDCNLFAPTDFCAHFVFLKMEELREVHLPSGVEFSPRYEELLREKLIVLQIGDGN